MKITQIIYTGFGGLGSVAFSLIEADSLLDQVEWQLGFIGDLRIDESYPLRCKERGVVWKEIRSRAGRPYKAWFELARWLNQVRPEAIILHSINSIPPCRWHAWRHHVPLIAVEHTPNAVKTRNEWMASRLCMLLADKVVLLTPEYEKELAGAHGMLYRRNKVRIIPNGISTSVFRPAVKRRRRSRQIRLGMAARFSFSKRQDTLVKMTAELKRRNPELEWRLSLAGDGDELERVRALVSELGLQEAVKFEGLLNEPDLAEWFRNLDIYVHGSDGETLSTSLLQAMASGLPIVASDIPGIRNLLVRGDCSIGDLAMNSPIAFADVVGQLAPDEKRKGELGKRARAVCETEYSNAAMLEAYLKVIDEVTPVR